MENKKITIEKAQEGYVISLMNGSKQNCKTINELFTTIKIDLKFN